MKRTRPGIAVIGAGIVGIATAYFLARQHGITDIALVDQGQPMTFTSAQSGENYRNWWPHPLMVKFTDRSIDLMEEIARESDNRIAMTRRGYLLATRQADIQPLLDQVAFGLGGAAKMQIRCHDAANSITYQPAKHANWQGAPFGFDILQSRDLIRTTFPTLDTEVRNVLHVRRAGDLSGQQLGQYMLEWLREHGLRRITGMVEEIAARDEGFTLKLRNAEGMLSLSAGQIVNAAGPFAGRIARMLDVELPLYNVVQQKIAFADTLRTIRRDMPFAIDLDRQMIDWSEEERAVLLEESENAWLAEEMPGAIHCRPHGGDGGKWLKLGWAYNEAAETESWQPGLDPHFPEIVLRGAARLNPALKAYYGRLPRETHHYGGYYTRTADNWPLIGPMGIDGTYMACALSGHGTMAACAAGELAAAWIADDALPDYARPFSLDRYSDPSLVAPSETGSGLL